MPLRNCLASKAAVVMRPGPDPPIFVPAGPRARRGRGPLKAFNGAAAAGAQLFRTLDDYDTAGKTVLVRTDMNCPIDPDTMELLGTRRIEEAAETLRDMPRARAVVASHQGRVGNKDYTGMSRHAEVLRKMTGRDVTYVEDVIGESARAAISGMRDGQILLLDNLRLCAEENYEFEPGAAASTVMVGRLGPLFDLCVLDSFPTAHRSHPSIVGFPRVLPACAGRAAERELRSLDEIMTVAKAPHVVVLGGAKVADRIEAMRMLIENGRADHILLTGLIGSVFMRAQARLRSPLGIKREEEMVSRAHALIGEHPDVFATPVDVAVDRDGRRIEMDVREMGRDDQVADIGPKTIDYYARMISGAGTVFMSGPAGRFEDAEFSHGTRGLLRAVAGSMATTIVSGGHLGAALKMEGLAGKIDHVSTAGGALVLYLTGKKLPMMAALEEAAARSQ